MHPPGPYRVKLQIETFWDIYIFRYGLPGDFLI